MIDLLQGAFEPEMIRIAAASFGWGRRMRIKKPGIVKSPSTRSTWMRIGVARIPPTPLKKCYVQ
jgi:hypothetical protein